MRNPDGGVLCFDLATQTGFAGWKRGCEIEYGHYRLAKTGDDVGRYLNEHKRLVYGLMCKFQPLRSVVFEAPILPRQTQLATARKLLGLANVVEMLCDEFEIDCSEVHQQSARKHFCGHGRAGSREEIKALIVEEARARGYEPENDDEADAIAVLDFTLHAMKETGDLPIGRLFKGMAA